MSGYEVAEVLLDQAIHLLDQQGIRPGEPETIDVLRSAGAVRTEDGDRLFLRSRAVRRCLAGLPSAFNLFDREGRKSATLASKRTPEAPPACSATVPAIRFLSRPGVDPVEVTAVELPGLVRRITRSQLFDVYGIGPVPADVDPALGDMYAFYLYLLATHHPLIYRPRHPESLDRARDLLSVLRGSALAFDSRPLALVEIRFADPLQWTQLSGRLLIDAARRGFPLIVMPERISASSEDGSLSAAPGRRHLEGLVAGMLTAVIIAQESRVQAPVMWGAPKPAGCGPSDKRRAWQCVMDVGGLLGLPLYVSLDDGAAEPGPAGSGFKAASLQALGASLAGAQLVAWGGWRGPDCLDPEAVDRQSNLVDELRAIHASATRRRDSKRHRERELSCLDGSLRLELAKVMRRETEGFEGGPMPLSL